MKAVKEKIRFALWLKPETMEKIRAASAQDDCESLSEFIEKAVLAYLGYLSGGGNTAFLPGAFLSTMKGIVAESDHRHASMLFKLSVEMAMLMNIVAAFVRSARRLRSSSTSRRGISGGMRHSTTRNSIPMCI